MTEAQTPFEIIMDKNLEPRIRTGHIHCPICNGKMRFVDINEEFERGDEFGRSTYNFEFAQFLKLVHRVNIYGLECEKCRATIPKFTITNYPVIVYNGEPHDRATV
jgi:hypothetical protein